MKHSLMRISKELLLDALHLPMNTEIVEARCEFPYRDITFIVGHPDIPDNSITVTPWYTTEYDEYGRVVKITMDSWGSRP